MAHQANRQTTSLEDALDALSHVQRRMLLLALLEPRNRSTSSFAVADGTTDDTDARLVEMDDVHLPKLQEYGFIERDPETNEVWRGPRYEHIVPILRLLEEQDGTLP